MPLVGPGKWKVSAVLQIYPKKNLRHTIKERKARKKVTQGAKARKAQRHVRDEGAKARKGQRRLRHVIWQTPKWVQYFSFRGNTPGKEALPKITSSNLQMKS